MAVLNNDYWATPVNLTVGIINYLLRVGEINWTQYYDLDCCANIFNSKVPNNFISERENALQVDWNGERVWCNPPYSRGNVEQFVNKAIEQTQKSKKDVIMLINVDPSTKYFKTIVENAKAIVYVVGKRIKFINPHNGDNSNPLKPSMFVLFSSTKYADEPVISYYADLEFLEELGNGNPQ